MSKETHLPTPSPYDLNAEASERARKGHQSKDHDLGSPYSLRKESALEALQIAKKARE
jgi:hypothetical protein